MTAWVVWIALAAGDGSRPEEDGWSRGGMISTASVQPASVPQGTVRCRNGWSLVETPNFRVWARDDRGLVALADHCERTRTELQRLWLGQSVRSAWIPACDVLIHSSIDAYNQALGRSQDRSVGATQVDLDGERIVRRRIDVRCDVPDWQTAALPHELTHVVLADRFGRDPLPRWADEGMAVLSEAISKQQLRRRALHHCVARGEVYPVAELLTRDCFPTAEWTTAYYSQSAVLVAYLVSRGTPRQFVAFLERSRDAGYEQALWDTYRIRSLNDLQRLCAAEWHPFTSEVRPVLAQHR